MVSIQRPRLSRDDNSLQRSSFVGATHIARDVFKTPRMERYLVNIPLNLGLIAILLGACFSTGSIAAENDKDLQWITLFDGKSLDAWRGYQMESVPPGWVAEDGVLKHESGEIDLMTRDTFADFELCFDWRISRNGNSGIIYRCSDEERSSYMTGPEFQLIDNDGWQFDGKDPQATGAVYGLAAPAKDVVRPTGNWNSARIVVRAGHVEHWLNGELIATAELGGDDWPSRIAGTKFAEWKRFGTLPDGRIALQAHKGRTGEMDPVWFRNVKVRRLPIAPREFAE